MKRLLLLLALTATIATWARPNFGQLTDGRYKYNVEGDADLMHMVLKAYDGDELMALSMHSTAEGYVVDSLHAVRMPEPYRVGDSVRVSGLGLVFFGADGRPYASMKPCHDYDEPAQMRRRDSLRVVMGSWTYGNGGKMVFAESADGKPYITPSAGMAEEPMEFQPDVDYGSRHLIHIKTAKRRWLLELTATGMNVYQAVRRNGVYVRGKLLRRAKGSTTILIDDGGLPFVDILARYFDDERLNRLTNR